MTSQEITNKIVMLNHNTINVDTENPLTAGALYNNITKIMNELFRVFSYEVMTNELSKQFYDRYQILVQHHIVTKYGYEHSSLIKSLMNPLITLDTISHSIVIKFNGPMEKLLQIGGIQNCTSATSFRIPWFLPKELCEAKITQEYNTIFHPYSEMI